MIAIASAKVFVRGLKLEAEVGVYSHERGRRQPLVVDVELDVEFDGSARLADTFNYERVRSAATEIADSGHIELVEGFTDRLARALLEDQRVICARVRVEKPLALAPDADAAGVELILQRL